MGARPEANFRTPRGIAALSLFLDTTILIDALRGRPAAARLRSMSGRVDAPYTCAVNVEELWRGLRERERLAAQTLVEGLRMAPLTAEVGQTAGAWRRVFAEQGSTLTQSDCLIAAAAASVGATLATGNPKDFPMKGLEVEHWAVGA